MTRVHICGGRDFDDVAAVSRTLALYKPVPIAACGAPIIIHGGCPTGADKGDDASLQFIAALVNWFRGIAAQDPALSWEERGE